MNGKETQVNPIAHFSLFRVTFSHIVSQGEGINKGGVLDLKTLFRAHQDSRRIIHSLGKNAGSFIWMIAFFKPQKSAECMQKPPDFWLRRCFGEGVDAVKILFKV